MMRAKEQVILVTGSTKGIGKSIAIEAAKEGGIVVVHGRNESDGHFIVEEIKANGGTAKFIKADITKMDECEFLINETIKNFSRIDVLVNNAGVILRADFIETSEALFNQIIDTNFKSAYFLTQLAAKQMLKQESGNIINIISTDSSVGQNDLSMYACAQAALRTLSKQSARLFVRQNIRCNTIIVGCVKTPGLVNSYADRDIDFSEQETITLETIPLGCFQTGEDIAAGVLYFIDPESRYISGTELDISGGIGIR